MLSTSGPGCVLLMRASCVLGGCPQLKAKLAAKKKKAEVKPNAAKLSAIALAEAKARKAKLNKQKDSTKFNQVGGGGYVAPCRKEHAGHAQQPGAGRFLWRAPPLGRPWKCTITPK